MNILNRYTNLVIAGVLDYSSCENIISFNSENRKDYELYKTLISKFKNIKHSTFIKEKEVNKDKVLKKFYEAMYDQNNEDLFIFYFTGHGSLSENNEPGLLMSNGDIISKTELKNIIKQNYQNQKIILLGDFCYSGLLADIAIELNNDDLNDALDKLKAIEPFIINSVHFSELLSESYIKILKDSNNTELKEDLAKYIAEIINSLAKCSNKLKVNSENA